MLGNRYERGFLSAQLRSLRSAPMVIDAHIHLCKFFGSDYLVPDFLEDLGADHRVEASIYVECNTDYSDNPDPVYRPIGETSYAASQAELASGANHRLAAGIIGSADLSLGEGVRPVLEAHIKAGRNRFRGVRVRLAQDPDPEAGYHLGSDAPPEDLVHSPALLEGARCVESLGLMLEIWAFHTQLRDLRRLAAQCPNLKIVLNHMGGPLGVGRYARQRGEVFRRWSAGLRAIAEIPNVYIKLSGVGVKRLGFGTSLDTHTPSADEISSVVSPYLMECVDAFGPDRCIFGSNFPVDRTVASYGVLLSAYRRALGALSDDEIQAIFAGNARFVYGV